MLQGTEKYFKKTEGYVCLENIKYFRESGNDLSLIGKVIDIIFNGLVISYVIDIGDDEKLIASGSGFRTKKEASYEALKIEQKKYYPDVINSNATLFEMWQISNFQDSSPYPCSLQKIGH
ncbi:hypothetical protein [Streptococcus halichoeri]|uniref:hypothetical protein n=1 Tax=Streptococcus halichoeri TaxID=254785 RepID=UPI001F20AD6F|nr:hypothetical protein [Streptococcus halichoeri]